jgi:actin-like ATPase involved in cell morphogenesis
MAEALDALSRDVGYSDSTVVAVPGYWGQNAVAALREAVLSKPSLKNGNMPATLVSDATAALASLYSKPGFPTDGVVVLCDFGAGGTSVTLSDAASDFRHIGETVRYGDFSGNRLDKAILHRLRPAFTAADSNTASTTPPDLLARQLDECRGAKERLSSATLTVIPAEKPFVAEEVRLSRPELEEMISEPLDQFITTVEELLRRSAIPSTKLAAVATVGGGGCIPLVTKRLEQRLHTPVVTTRQPIFSAAAGAAAFAEQRLSAGPPTDVVIPPDAVAGAAPPTDVDPSAWAVGAARLAAAQSAEDGVASATYRALAWSEDDSRGDEPLPYIGENEPIDPAAATVTAQPHDHVDVAAAPAQPAPAAAPAQPAPAPAPRRGRLRTLFGLTVMVALATLLGAGVMMSKLANTPNPTQTTTSLPPPKTLPKVGPLPPPPPPPPSTVTVTDTPSVETTVVVPPPRHTNPTTTTTIAPTTTTPRPTTSEPTTTPTYPSSPSSYPTPYPASPPVTTPPTTAVLVPPRTAPVYPYVP